MHRQHGAAQQSSTVSVYMCDAARNFQEQDGISRFTGTARNFAQNGGAGIVMGQARSRSGISPTKDGHVAASYSPGLKKPGCSVWAARGWLAAAKYRRRHRCTDTHTHRHTKVL